MKPRQLNDNTIEMTDITEHETVPVSEEESSEREIAELQNKYAELTWQSWKCFGLKLVAPLLPLVAGAAGIASLAHSFNDKTDADKTKDVIAGIATGVGSVGLFSFGLKQAKIFHAQQKKIDHEREEIAEEIKLFKSFS